MTSERPAWHVNDVVAYDLMREAAADLQARLSDLASRGQRGADKELFELRRTTLAVDGFDRAAVDAHAKGVRARALELAEAAASGA